MISKQPPCEEDKVLSMVPLNAFNRFHISFINSILSSSHMVLSLITMKILSPMSFIIFCISEKY